MRRSRLGKTKTCEPLAMARWEILDSTGDQALRAGVIPATNSALDHGPLVQEGLHRAERCGALHDNANDVRDRIVLKHHVARPAQKTT